MQKLKKLKHIFVVIVVSLSAVFGGIFLFSAEFSNAINGFFIYRTGENTWQDRIYTHTLRPSNDIAIIRIDNESLNALQSKGNLKMLTIPKSYYITLIEKLEAAGVKGIAFDIIFENADKEDKNEELFAKALEKYKNIVIASEYTSKPCLVKMELFQKIQRTKQNGDTREATGGIMVKNYDDEMARIDEEDCPRFLIKAIQENFSKLDSNEVKKYEWAKSIDTNKWKQEYTNKLLCEQDQTGSYATCSGVPRSVYSNVRWGIVSMGETDAYTRLTSGDISRLPYALWKSGTGKMTEPKLYTLPLALYGSTQSGMTYGALASFERFKVNPFFGPSGSYPSLSFIDGLEMGRRDTIQTFKGKYVFIGESGTAIHDSVESPVNGKPMDGVETHAHYFDGLLQDKMIEKISVDISYSIIVLSVLLMVILYFFLPSTLSLILALVLPIAVIYIARYSYDVDRILLDIFPLLLAGSITTFPITYIYRFFVVDREKRQLKSNFAHYIDPHVVDQIAAKSDTIELGGEKRNLSVFFSDIAGFTTISETLDPRDLFYLMTSYLSYMTDILIKEGGTLDKYIGDAVMGFFGAPIPYEDHAIRSANTAIHMRKALAKFNMEIGERGIESIDFRVGIASGDVMVGNIGSHDRFNYTVLGDTVNLASRLEGTGKEYDVHIIISHATKMALTPHFFTRELDTIAVKGKTEGIRIHELVGYSEEFVDRTKYTLYERALGLYRAGDYREAGKLWQTQVSLDPPSRVMMLRCVDILKGNIDVKNGVYQMLHK